MGKKSYKQSTAQLTRQLREEIDRLRHELGRYRKKIIDQQACIADLQVSLEQYRLGYDELAADRHAFVASTAMRWGWPVENGWEISVPFYNLQELVDKYTVVGRRDEEKQAYLFRVTEKQEVEDNGDC